MDISYEQLLSPNPIPISMDINGKIKTIYLKKHTLKDIDMNIGFSIFSLYQSILTITPKTFYEEYCDNDNPKKEEWFNLTNEEKDEISLFDLAVNDIGLRNMFVSIFYFFFDKKAFFVDAFNKFIFVDKDAQFETIDDLSEDDVYAIVGNELFLELVDVIAKTCYIKLKKKEKVKYRNKRAQRIYEKINNGEKNKKKKPNSNDSIGNIISKVSNRHNSLNPISVWDLTYFQLIDAFYAMQMNEGFDMNKMSVSVWGDKDKKFDSTLWYKNTFE